MLKVFKYPLDILDEQKINLPKGAECLSIQEQHDQFCLWALVDPDEQMVERRAIYCIGTGNPVYDIDLMKQTDFISTTLYRNGSLVWHWFVEKAK